MSELLVDLIDLEGESVFNEVPSGAIDGANFVFATAQAFEPSTLRVYVNGVRKREGAAHDFTTSESGGAGAGFDTITFVNFAPRAGDNLLVDYVAAIG